MAFLASGRLVERLASLPERHQMTAFQEIRPEPVGIAAQEVLLWPPERLANGVSQNQMGNIGWPRGRRAGGRSPGGKGCGCRRL